MIPRRPSVEQQRQLIAKGRVHNGRGEHLQSLTTSTVCFVPIDLTLTHPMCPATLALDKDTKQLHIFDGSKWIPFSDSLKTQEPLVNDPTLRELKVKIVEAQPDENVVIVEPDIPVVETPIDAPVISDSKIAPSGSPQYTVFSDKDFTLFSNGMNESIVNFEVVPLGKPRTITVPRENALLPAIDDRSNTMLGGVAYASSEGVCKDNTLLGADSGISLSSGSYNVSLGSMALSNCVTGDNNISIGYKSMVDVSSGDDNISIGYKSLRKVQGECNIAIGSFSQALNTTGNGNVSLGQDSLYALSSGKSNVALGFEAGVDCQFGDDNTLIGAQTYFAPGVNGSIVLGSGGKATCSDQLVISGKMSGEVQLQSGTGVVVFSGITSSSRILLTTQNPIGVVGYVYVSGRIPGTGFTISSSSINDNSMVAWFAFDP